MADERDFQVIDKRGGKPEGGQESGGASAKEIQQAAAEAAAQTEAGGDEMTLDVPGALSVCVNMLNEVAWMKMGLIPNPMTGKIERDLPQAKIAIDAVSDLVARLEPLVGDPGRRELQVMLSNLRINFVQQGQRG